MQLRSFLSSISSRLSAHPPRPFFWKRIALGFLFLGPFFCAQVLGSSAAQETLARRYLMEVLENQTRKPMEARIRLAYLDFPRGWDTLSGTLRFEDALGRRTLDFRYESRSRKGGYHYASENFGREQWIRDSLNQRARRIANRQWKKPAFGLLLTYEDWLKFPAGYILDYGNCLALSETDSTVALLVNLRPLYQSYYARAHFELSKVPSLLRRITFYNGFGRPVKVLELGGYVEENGKWFPRGFTAYSPDSAALVRAFISDFRFEALEAPAPGIAKILPSLPVDRKGRMEWQQRWKTGPLLPVSGPEAVPGTDGAEAPAGEAEPVSATAVEEGADLGAPGPDEGPDAREEGAPAAPAASNASVTEETGLSPAASPSSPQGPGRDSGAVTPLPLLLGNPSPAVLDSQATAPAATAISGTSPKPGLAPRAKSRPKLERATDAPRPLKRRTKKRK